MPPAHAPEIELKCGHCGQVFYLKRRVYQGRLARTKTGKVYCSRACGTRAAFAMGLGVNGPPEWGWITCVWCGTKRRRRMNWIRQQDKRSVTKLTFCDRSCSSKFTARKEIRAIYRRMKLPSPENMVVHR